MKSSPIIRQFDEQDIEQVATFLRRIHVTDQHVDDLEDEAFRAFVGLDVNRGGRDFRIVELNGDIVAVLLSGTYRVMDRHWPLRGFKIVVAPEMRGRGLGSRLLDELKVQDDLTATIHRTVIAGDWPSGVELLSSRGFVTVQEISILRRQGSPPAMPDLDDGFHLRDADMSRDAQLITDLHNVANRRSFGFAPLSVTELRESVGAPGGRLLVLELADGTIIGSAQTLPYMESVGVLHSVQVDPQYQGRGLGRFLVCAALNALARQGFRVVEVSVDCENRAAVNLYGTLHFEAWRQDRTYERVPRP